MAPSFTTHVIDELCMALIEDRYCCMGMDEVYRSTRISSIHRMSFGACSSDDGQHTNAGLASEQEEGAGEDLFSRHPQSRGLEGAGTGIR